ncbi:MAG: serine/threonine protein kinase [Candidatus Obscuribacterales bacterium]|nr:serine/threonine protein kinase [Candidatus Obscuribacterales bacterium]
MSEQVSRSDSGFLNRALRDSTANGNQSKVDDSSRYSFNNFSTEQPSRITLNATEVGRHPVDGQVHDPGTSDGTDDEPEPRLTAQVLPTELRLKKEDSNARLYSRVEVIFPSLSDNLEVLESIGSGSAADVYKVRDKRKGCNLAAKVFHGNGLCLKRFRHEVELASRLVHPNIVSPTSLFETFDGRPYLLMQPIDGMSLEKVIAMHGRLSIQDCASIAMQIVDALEYAHRNGVSHQQLTARNVLLTGGPESWHAMIADFGTAKLSSFMNSKRDGEVLELIRAAESSEVDVKQMSGKQVDIYSLGCLLYQMLTATRYTDALNVVARQQKCHYSQQKRSQKDPIDVAFKKLSVPEALRKLISKCLEEDPNRRFHTTRQLKNHMSKVFVASRSARADERIIASVIDFGTIALIAAAICPHSISCFLFVLTVYYSLWECSRYKASPGKLFTGICVQNRLEKSVAGQANWLASLLLALLVAALLYLGRAQEIVSTVGTTKASQDCCAIQLLLIGLYSAVSLIWYRRHREWLIDSLTNREVVKNSVLWQPRQSCTKTTIPKEKYLATGAIVVALLLSTADVMDFLNICVSNPTVDLQEQPVQLQSLIRPKI